MKTYSRKSSRYLKKAFVGSNFNEMCRLCLSENEAVLTPIINYKISYQEWIQYSIDVLVEEGDGLPPNICDECLGMVEQTYLFKKKCKASDSKLREHFELLDLTEECKMSNIDFNDTLDGNDLYQKKHPGEENCNESSAIDSGGTEKELPCENGKGGDTLTESATKNLTEVSIESKAQESNEKTEELESKACEEAEKNDNKNLKKDNTANNQVKIQTCVQKPGKTVVKEIKRYILKGEIREGDQEEDLTVCEVVPLDVRNYEYAGENEDNIDFANLTSLDENGCLIQEESTTDEQNKCPVGNSKTRIQEIYKLWDNEEEGEDEIENKEEGVFFLDMTWEEYSDKDTKKEILEKMEVESDQNGALQTHRVYTNKNQIKIIETRPQKSFSCFACSEIFSSYASLKEHLSKYHKEVCDTPFCEVCGKSFTCANSLKRHMAVHTGFKPYKCKICERKFSQGSILKRHVLTHENQKPFNCHICQKSYTQKMNLLTHLKNHGFRTGAESFSCKLCSKTFVHQSGLSRHIKLHKGVRFICVHCKKSFGDASALTRHVKAVHQQQT